MSSCKKQAQRNDAIAALPPIYRAALTSTDKSILNAPVSVTAERVREGALLPYDVLLAFSKRTLWAHAQTNCLSEVAITQGRDLLALSCSHQDSWGEGLPLAGIPVSVKDTVSIAGYDSTIGYSKYAFKPAAHDAPLIRLLRDAGAIVPFVKTNVPITLLAFESTNDVFGRTANPHNYAYSPGGSSGGEAALLALRGSRIGIGTDVAGSVRVPAAWSGIYALRCSTGRFPRSGNMAAMAGQEGVPAVYSPMATTLPDLRYLFESVLAMRPWEYDHTVHPLPLHRTGDEPMMEIGRLRWGVLRSDGVVPPTPAIQRALDTTIAALRAYGDEVVELADPPSCYAALRLAIRLLNADAGETYASHFTSFFESNDPGVAVLSRFFALPRLAKRLYAWYLRLRGDPVTAGLVDDLCTRSVADQWRLVTEREAVRAQWFDYLRGPLSGGNDNENEPVGLILTPVHALPGLPAGGGKDTIAACGYTFLWNLLDYAAGVVPVGRVDPACDDVNKATADADGRRGNRRGGNMIARKAWALYDARKMAGLPIAVQVVSGRLQEEAVLTGMERVVNALAMEGVDYHVLEL